MTKNIIDMTFLNDSIYVNPLKIYVFVNTCTDKNMNWIYTKFMTAATLWRKKKGWKPNRERKRSEEGKVLFR